MNYGPTILKVRSSNNRYGTKINNKCKIKRENKATHILKSIFELEQSRIRKQLHKCEIFDTPATSYRPIINHRNNANKLELQCKSSSSILTYLHFDVRKSELSKRADPTKMFHELFNTSEIYMYAYCNITANNNYTNSLFL